MCSCHLNFVNKQTQQVENIVSKSFQIIAYSVTMPPKSDYWKYFVVQGVLAVCQLQGCPKSNVSLRALATFRSRSSHVGHLQAWLEVNHTHIYIVNTPAQKYRLSTTVNCQSWTCPLKYHIVLSVPCTSHHKKYRLRTTVSWKHCTCMYL